MHAAWNWGAHDCKVVTGQQSPDRETWRVDLQKENISWSKILICKMIYKAMYCKGTLILAFFTDGISPLHDSGHIPSMRHPVRPTTSLVKPPSLRSPLTPSPFHRLVQLCHGSITGTQNIFWIPPNLIPLFAIVVTVTIVVLSPLSHCHSLHCSSCI